MLAHRGLSRMLLNRRVFDAVSSSVRSRHHLPINTGAVFVPQQEAWIVERMGRFHSILKPGLNLLIPVLDRIKYVQSLKEMAIEIPKQSAVTSDNVTLSIDGVLYLRVTDPYKASYGVEDPEFAITQLAQTTMRSELGKISLDSVFKERESLNIGIVEAINKAGQDWGVACLRYEIRDIKLPERVQEAMQMQVEAERKKRARVLESEGIREYEINVAEGKKKSRILASEADRSEMINRSTGEASAIEAVATAKATALTSVSKALHNDGHEAAALSVAEKYVDAFKHLAQQSNTLILPKDVGDVSSSVAQAMQVYKSLTGNRSPPSIPPSTASSSFVPPSSTSPSSFPSFTPFPTPPTPSDTNSPAGDASAIWEKELERFGSAYQSTQELKSSKKD